VESDEMRGILLFLLLDKPENMFLFGVEDEPTVGGKANDLSFEGVDGADGRCGVLLPALMTSLSILMNCMIETF
jgi:hypothetical protein